MENQLQVSCCPFRAKFLKAFSQFDSIKSFRMQSTQQSVSKRTSECWNRMQLDAPCKCGGKTLARSIRKDCPERRDDGLWLYFKQSVIPLHGNDKHPVGAALSSGCSSAPGPLRNHGKELPCGCSRKHVLHDFTSSRHCDALTDGFEILKERGFCLYASSAWSLTILQATPASPAWSRQQRVRTFCVLCQCTSTRFVLRKTTSVPLNWGI